MMFIMLQSKLRILRKQSTVGFYFSKALSKLKAKKFCNKWLSQYFVPSVVKGQVIVMVITMKDIKFSKGQEFWGRCCWSLLMEINLVKRRQYFWNMWLSHNRGQVLFITSFWNMWLSLYFFQVRSQRSRVIG